MKFLYEYRTSDNARHNGVVCAANRDEAYARLKTQGVRPSRLEEAPGFVNKLFGRGKRWLAIVVLAALCAALAIAVWRGALTAPRPSAVDASLDSPVRRQLIGDAAVIEKGIRTGWSDVFSHEGDRFLASFAIPGVPAGQRSTTEEKLREALDDEPSIHPNPPNIQTSLEARQIRAMVDGMKQELRDFLADGGTVVEYGHRLVQRQEEELRYYNMVKTELESAAKSGMPDAALEKLWESRNAKLRAMGIKLVPMPET